jgi:hypothetical protein
MMPFWASMNLSDHDLQILCLAARDVEGRLGFTITEEGSIQLSGFGDASPLAPEETLPRLVERGLLARGLNRTYVLTPGGWEAVKAYGGS